MQTKQENQLEINNSIGTAGYARTVGEDGKSYRTGISDLVSGAIGGDIEQLENDVEALQTTVGEHTTDIQNNSDDISDLQTLTSGHTTSIGNLQTAVETNAGNIATNATAIGTLANLTTTENSNLVGAINEVNEDVSDVKEELEHISGISDDVKDALLQIASKVAYIDEDGQDYYDALYDALYPPVDLVSISANYTQSGDVYDTDSLDDLKPDLVVTANYSDSSTEVITDYTLSGTLEVGTSTITVSYSGKTTTFNVTVTEPIVLTGYTEIGSPTITDNILTVGEGKFITCNQPFEPSNEPWEVICKYQRTETFGSYTDVIGSVDSTGASIRGFLLEYSNGPGTNGAIYCSSNSTSWDITTQQTVDTIPDALNTWVWVSVAFTGTAYVFKTSTDGETWTTQKTISSTTPIYDETGASVGFGLKRSGWIRGKIDLTGCMIYKNGNLWWKAV